MPPERGGLLPRSGQVARWHEDEILEPPMRVLGGHIYEVLGPRRKGRPLVVAPVIRAALIHLESEQRVAGVMERRVPAPVEDE